MKESLTTELLESEFRAWTTPRNKDDLRFGQYLYSAYSLVPDSVFYTEDPKRVYEILKGVLADYQR